MNQFQYRNPSSGTDVEYFQLVFLFVVQDAVHSCYVSLCQVYYVDVITDARTVGGVVVITEYGQLFTDTDSGLSQVRDEVLRNSIGQFTDKSCRMCTNRVEVAQQDSMDRRT